jgi:hypothetical protein
MNRCYKKHPLHEGDDVLVERSEALNQTINTVQLEEANLATTMEAQGDGPCSGWAQAKCSVKASWSWDFDGVYEECMQECLDEYNGDALVTKRSENDAYQDADSNLVTRDAEGDVEEHHCENTSVQLGCSVKSLMNLWGYMKHYKMCIQECIDLHEPECDADCEGDGEGEGEGESEGDASLSKRSENDTLQHANSVLVSNGTQTNVTKLPCDEPWIQRSCHIRTSAFFWSYGKHYRACMQECIDNFNAGDYGKERDDDALLTKRSENNTINTTTLETSDMINDTVVLIQQSEEDTDVYPQEGRLGGINDGDDHHCNNTWVYAKCSAESAVQFWNPMKAFHRCLAKCVRENDGDNWTA